MSKGKRLTLVEQCKIDILIEQGWSVNKISNYIKRSRTVISKYINIGGQYNKKVYKKRRSKLTSRQIQKVFNDASNKKTSCAKKKGDNKLKVDKTTI